MSMNKILNQSRVWCNRRDKFSMLGSTFRAFYLLNLCLFWGCELPILSHIKSEADEVSMSGSTFNTVFAEFVPYLRLGAPAFQSGADKFPVSDSISKTLCLLNSCLSWGWGIQKFRVEQTYFQCLAALSKLCLLNVCLFWGWELLKFRVDQRRFHCLSALFKLSAC